MASEEDEIMPDRLRPLFADSEFAQGVLRELDDTGYIVLPGVFTREEADSEYERMWRWVERVSHGIKRSRPETWQRRRGQDPWPCTQRDMMQAFQAGWVFTEARERMAERVFERLYGTKALHTSKDGFTLQRPTSTPINPAPNDHFDQRGNLTGLQCVQGSVALTDQEEEDGCFLCWPGSHRLHPELAGQKDPRRARQDWIRLDEQDFDSMRSQGVTPRRVPVRRGDVILWRSDLAHKGAPPLGCRDGFRGVIYICMLPSQLTPEEIYPKKQQAYLQLETSGHLPFREDWFRPKGEITFDLRPYFSSPPELTPRQRLLYGLDRYAEPGPLHSPAVSCEVVRLARRSAADRGEGKRANPLRLPCESIQVDTVGVSGDYNHYRTTSKGGTTDRAVSIVTTQEIAALREKGFDVKDGELGENITLRLPEGVAGFSVGMRLKGEGAEMELTEPIVPCANLELLSSLREDQRRVFPAACKGLRGWYARVLQPGEIKVGSGLTLLAHGGSDGILPEAAAAQQPVAKATESAGSSRRKRWQKVEK